jgi:hypothetical protein
MKLGIKVFYWTMQITHSIKQMSPERIRTAWDRPGEPAQ